MQEKTIFKTCKYDKQYKDADKYIIFNDNDPEVRPVVLRLPEPPPVNYIDGYAKAPEDQKFSFTADMPKIDRLAQVALQKAQDSKYEGRMVSYMQQKLFWQMLGEEAEHYQDEIEKIKNIHWYLRYGYWCFIYGKPTWIPPKHFFYLVFYYANAVDHNKIDYRDEDRIVKVFEHYADTTTETFAEVDGEGYAVPNEDGMYDMIDVGCRTSLGTQHPKRRRKGITMQCCSDAIYVAITGKERHVIIQANTGKAAEDIYKDHIQPAWNNLKIWLKPIYDGNQTANEGIYFKTPSSVVGERYLDGYIIWNDSAKEGMNDRRKAHFILNDEAGKNDRGDVDKRWRIDKLTMTQGADIHGIARNPSTVEEMTSGGEAYQKMFSESDFYRRDMTGMTTSGVFRLFRPVWQGWDGYVDEWGYSVTHQPTEAQLKNPPPKSRYHIRKQGSYDFWVHKYDGMLLDPNEANNYRMEIRKHPMVSSDCWRGGSGDLGWNALIMDQALAAIRVKDETTRGNFILKDGVSQWIPSKDGRFVITNLFLETSNKWVYGDQVWDEKTQKYVPAKRPANPKLFTMGVDPFDYGGTANPSKRSEFHLSNGGIAIIQNALAEESEINIRDAETPQLVLWYEHKPPSLNDFCEDVLAAAVFYGAMINVETNKKRVIEFLIDSGYAGYIWRGTNPDGTFKKDFGTYSGAGTKNDMLNGIRDFIEYRGHKCKIKEFLMDARSMTNPKMMSFRDGLTAVGWAIYASTGVYASALDRAHKFNANMNLVDWYGAMRRY